MLGEVIKKRVQRCMLHYDINWH